jgi:hypothetical protein
MPVLRALIGLVILTAAAAAVPVWASVPRVVLLEDYTTVF